MITDLLLFGNGGHALACLDVIRATKRYNVVGYIDSDSGKKDDWEGIPCVGTDLELATIIKPKMNLFLGVGQIQSTLLRRSIIDLVAKYDVCFPVIQSPYSYVSDLASVGRGTIIMHHAFVGPRVKIGEFNILNNKSSLEHGSQTDSFVHLATASVINGDVKIGSDVFVGSNSVICQGIEVPSNSFIQAGTFVGRKHDWR